MRCEGTEPKIWTNGGNQRADFYHRMRFVLKWFSDKSALNTDDASVHDSLLSKQPCEVAAHVSP